MLFRWLKHYMPRSLYGRAALILILPVITLQLAVSIVFIQRHFEDVTKQMTGSILLDLQYLLDQVDKAETLPQAQALGETLAAPLRLTMSLPAEPVPQAGTRRWFDFSGRVVAALLAENIESLGPVMLPDDRRVELWFETAHGVMRVEFQRQRVSATNPHQLLVWMVVLGVFMTVIAYIYLRNQLRPIERLSVAAAEYGRGRVVPYKPRGAVEVRAAGHAFVDMRNRIEKQTQARTMMLSGVSHDLRTPLTRLRLGLGLIDSEEVAPLVRDVDDMQRLLDGFLEFARGDAQGEVEACDPHALADQIIADAHRMGQAVEAGEMEGRAHGTVPLRALAVRRAVENLIGNALRYGGTRARLSVAVTPRVVRFCVEDNGQGIPADQRETALRPFARLDPARNQDNGSGVGLGLAIVEDIARVHGGSVRLGESADLGGLKVDLILAR